MTARFSSFSARFLARHAAIGLSLAFAGVAHADTFSLLTFFGGTGSTDVTLFNSSLGVFASVGPEFETSKPKLPPDTSTAGGGSTGGGLGYIDAMGNAITVGDAWITTETEFISDASRGGAPEVRVRIRAFVTYDPTQWSWSGSNVFSSFGGDPANIFGFTAEEPQPYIEVREGTPLTASQLAVIGVGAGGGFPAGSLADGEIATGAYRVFFNVGLIGTPAEPTRSIDATYRLIVPAPGSAALIIGGVLITARRRRRAV
jgi:hypothetical protein